MIQTDTPTKVSAGTIRQSLAIYSDPDAPLFKGQGFILSCLQFLLRSACLSLEVFLHAHFGKRYLTVPKLLTAIFFPCLCLYFAQFDFKFEAGVSLTQPGFLQVIRPNSERIADAVANEVETLEAKVREESKKRIEALKARVLKYEEEAERKIQEATEKVTNSPLAERVKNTKFVESLKNSTQRQLARLESESVEAEVDLELQELEATQLKEASEEGMSEAARQPRELTPSIWNRTRIFFRRLLNPLTRVDLLYGIGQFFVVFSIFANLQLIWIYLSRIFEGVFDFREAHPHSSGEPLFIFNPFYLLAHRFNAKTDLVKQFVEPALCYMLGLALRENVLSDNFKFISAWLMLGGFLIFIRVYIENRNREKMHLDRLANERNAESYNLQLALVQSGEDSSESVKARGR